MRLPYTAHEFDNDPKETPESSLIQSRVPDYTRQDQKGCLGDQSAAECGCSAHRALGNGCEI